MYIGVGGCGVLCRLFVLHEALEGEACVYWDGWVGEITCRLWHEGEAMCMLR